MPDGGSVQTRTAAAAGGEERIRGNIPYFHYRLAGMHEPEKQQLGHRIRRHRIQAGLTMETVAQAATISTQTLRGWERGEHAYQPWRVAGLASALGVPIAQLFVDELVLAEVRVSEETLERVRKTGREQAKAAADRIASQLEPLIWAAATQPPADVRPGARAAKKRASRREVLAGVKRAEKARRAARRREIS